MLVFETLGTQGILAVPTNWTRLSLSFLLDLIPVAGSRADLLTETTVYGQCTEDGRDFVTTESAEK